MSAVMKHGNMGHFVPHGANRLSQAAAAGRLSSEPESSCHTLPDLNIYYFEKLFKVCKY